jgi:hypothetical protein
LEKISGIDVSNKRNPDLSIVILTYNIRDLALECLESVKQASEGLHAEIIVSDNGSSDGTQEAIRQRYPEVILIENKENLGYAVGNNRGIAVSAGKHILILNPDTVVEKDTLKLTLHYMENHPKCGIVGCKVLNTDGTVQQSWFPEWSLRYAAWVGFGLYKLVPLNRIDRRWTMTRKPPELPVVVDRLLGCFLWIRGEVIKQVGRFDEDFFLYGEEEDLCKRVRDKGWEVHYYPEPHIVHLGGQSTSLVAERARIESNVSKLRWMKKHRSSMAVLAFRLIWSVALMIRILLRSRAVLFSQYQKTAFIAEAKSLARIWRR